MLYLLSVAAIVACVTAVVGVVHFFWLGKPTPGVFIASTCVTLLVIALGTVEVLAQLSLGKGELALMLAGRQINRGSGLDDERRLINVVDEIGRAHV